MTVFCAVAPREAEVVAPRDYNYAYYNDNYAYDRPQQVETEPVVAAPVGNAAICGTPTRFARITPSRRICSCRWAA
jgi:hypothetical protein